MYYSYPCSYCSKVFYTYDSHKSNAAKTLYYGIKQHLIDYDEDHKEYQFDDPPEIEIYEIYRYATELNEPPAGGYEL